MRRVLILCTVHRESGEATARELHWLLSCLRPDVIFVEHSSADFSAFVDGSCGTLESAAVMHYLNRNEAKLVPVDLDLQVAELKPEFDDMFERIAEASPRYCQLDWEDRQHLAMGGFAYLNSPSGALLHAAIQREVRATVDAIDDPGLSELYALWRRMNDRREHAMIDVVEEFGSHASFTKGVLLVGAAHRQPLFEKLELHGRKNRSVTWDFDWQLEETALRGDPQP